MLCIRHQQSFPRLITVQAILVEVKDECCPAIIRITAWPAQPGGGSGRTRPARGQIWPFSLFILFLSSGDGPAWFVAGAENGFTLAPRFARTTMYNTNTTPLTAEETRLGRDSNDTGFYLPNCSSSLQNTLSSNYENFHAEMDF